MVATEVIEMTRENFRRKLKMVFFIVLSFAAMC